VRRSVDAATVVTTMLEELRISSLGVIDSSTLELGPGLTVITGETGAGKTMVVTALGLLLGGRADPGAVRSGIAQARVEGVVSTGDLAGFREAVEESGGVVEDDRVVLARNVAAQGRSRAWVGGASVPVTTLAEIAEPLVAVHGQSDQHRLLKSGAQRASLDRFAGAAMAKTAADYAGLYAELAATERTLADVIGSARERAREADQLRFGLGEVEAVDPRPGEDLELAAEETRLGFADTLRTAAETAREALSSEDGAPDAMGTTSAARQALDGVREHDATAGELADRIAELGHLLVDVAGDVASYASSLETDPSRLAHVSERRAALTALTRKYGETIDEVLEWAEDGAKRLLDLEDADGSIAELEARRDRLRAELGALASKLSKQRTKAAVRLGRAVSDELTSLAMPHAVVSIAVTQSEVAAPAVPSGPVLNVDGRWLRATSSGVDEVEFLLAANTGADPRPLHKGASGGELSRVMLALEVSLAETGSVPTFVFDEVDAGVGGKAAIEVGRRLAALAHSSQVLVVTHLPQVAAYADRHVVVHKSSDGSVTTSGLVTLSEDERERELSRMLAGVEDSDSARAHARELLAAAAPDRACLPEGQGRG
jgi:DNA repair protein RecN (Recombination protein N)